MFRFATQMVIHLALQFLMDGFPQLADIAVRLSTNGSKPGGAVQPQREKIQDFLVFLAEISIMPEIKGSALSWCIS